MTDNGKHSKKVPNDPDDRSPTTDDSDGDENFSDLLNELRVLLTGTITLTAFLMILPFNVGFDKVNETEVIVYVVLFMCAVIALVLLMTPAAQHRLQRPLMDREAFKTHATRLIVAALVPLSISIVLITQFVIAQVVGQTMSLILGGVIAVLVSWLWWIAPLRRRDRS